VPTLIWIDEGDRERRLEKEEFPEIPILRFPCPYCQLRFDSEAEIEDHVNRAHVLELPVLLLWGCAAPSEMVIRRPIRADGVRLLNCRSCWVERNGRGISISPRDFPAAFAGEKDAHWTVRLTNFREPGNGTAQREYRIDFRIPADDQLIAVDQRFAEYLAVDQPDHPDLERFLGSCRVGGPAADYANALADYVLGVMLKEHSANLVAPVGFEEYRTKFQAADQVLRAFARPLAWAISGCVAFNLNSFAEGGRAIEVHPIQAGFDLFGEVIKGGRPRPRGRGPGGHGKERRCPVDTITAELLSLCERYMGGESLGVEDAERLERRRNTRVVSEYDLPKINVLCALVFLGIGEHDRARPHLDQIKFHQLFGLWSQSEAEACG
jgi:hypothetical protein